MDMGQSLQRHYGEVSSFILQNVCTRGCPWGRERNGKGLWKGKLKS